MHGGTYLPGFDPTVSVVVVGFTSAILPVSIDVPLYGQLTDQWSPLQIRHFTKAFVGSMAASFDFSSSLFVMNCMLVSSEIIVVCGFGPGLSSLESPNLGNAFRRATDFGTSCLTIYMC